MHVKVSKDKRNNDLKSNMLVTDTGIGNPAMAHDVIFAQPAEKHCQNLMIGFPVTISFDGSPETTEKFQMNLLFHEVNFGLWH